MFENVGLSYTFPETLTAAPQEQLPKDKKGREFIILALWNTPQKTPIPRVVFLYDLLQRPDGYSPGQIAEQYLRGISHAILLTKGAKLNAEKKAVFGPSVAWRLDSWQPSDSGQSYHAALVVPMKDRRVLSIDMNANSQQALNELVDSLKSIKLRGDYRP